MGDLRWRRLKFGVVEVSVREALEKFLGKQLYTRRMRKSSRKISRKFFAESASEKFAEEVKELAHQFVRSQPDAVKRVSALFGAAGKDADQIRKAAKAEKAKELAEAYGRREPEAFRLREQDFFGRPAAPCTTSCSWHCPAELDQIEQIDRLINIAETRRNISLREIDRRRMALGEALRRNLQEVEGEFKVLETTPADGQNPPQPRRELSTGRSKRTPSSGRRSQGKETVRRV